MLRNLSYTFAQWAHKDLFSYIIMLNVLSTPKQAKSIPWSEPLMWHSTEKYYPPKPALLPLYGHFLFHILHYSWMKSGVFWDVTHTVQEIGTIFRYKHQVHYLSNYTESHSSWTSLSYLPLWKPQISHGQIKFQQFEIMQHYFWKTEMVNS